MPEVIHLCKRGHRMKWKVMPSRSRWHCSLCATRQQLNRYHTVLKHDPAYMKLNCERVKACQRKQRLAQQEVKA